MQPLLIVLGRVLEKPQPELPCDPTILLLSMYMKDVKPVDHKATCTAMFIVVLFTRAQKWDGPKYPLADKENGVSIHEKTLSSLK